jgi:hypothetical protein
MRQNGQNGRNMNQAPWENILSILSILSKSDPCLQ